MDQAPTLLAPDQEVARQLQDGNIGLTISSNVIEYPSVSEAEAALSELRRAEVTAIQAAYAPRFLSVMYSSVLTQAVARAITVTGGQVVPKASALSWSAP